MDAAEETFEVAEECLKGAHYKDAINRSYYAVFYAVKAVLALEESGVRFAYPNGTQDDNYYTEIWIPVKKAVKI